MNFVFRTHKFIYRYKCQYNLAKKKFSKQFRSQSDENISKESHHVTDRQTQSQTLSLSLLLLLLLYIVVGVGVGDWTGDDGVGGYLDVLEMFAREEFGRD